MSNFFPPNPILLGYTGACGPMNGFICLQILGNNRLTFPLDFIILAQLSINVTNYQDLPKVVTMDEPHTSKWITIKRTQPFYKFNGNEARWLFASSQTSH